MPLTFIRWLSGESESGNALPTPRFGDQMEASANKKFSLSSTVSNGRESRLGGGTVRAWRFLVGLSWVALLLASSVHLQATVSITPASHSISADYAQNGGTPRFFDIGEIRIQEQSPGDFGIGTGVKLVLQAPSGWRFDTSTPPSPVPIGTDKHLDH